MGKQVGIFKYQQDSVKKTRDIMSLSRRLKNDDNAIELPINIVVMLVVGMVALAALLAIIPKSKENLSVDIINVTIGNNDVTKGNTAKIIGEGEHQVKVRIKVYDKNNNPVQKASATLSGGGGFGTDQTNSDGEAYIILGGQGGWKRNNGNAETKSTNIRVKACSQSQWIL